MTPRMHDTLVALGDHDALTRVKLQDVIGLNNDRVMRDLLGTMRTRGLIQKTNQEVASALGATAPVWFLAQRGKEHLIAEVDAKYKQCCTAFPQWTTLRHTVAVNWLGVLFRRAIALQTQAELCRWLNERQVVNPDDEKPIRLFTELRGKPKLVCKPDAGILLRMGAYAKNYYWEIDLGSSAVNQIAASKTPGYAELLKQQGHKRHFDTNMDTFSVLSVSLTPGRRDLLRAAFRGKEGAELWKFCSLDEFRPETALSGAIWFPWSGEPSPLVKRAVMPKAQELVGSGVGSA